MVGTLTVGGDTRNTVALARFALVAGGGMPMQTDATERAGETAVGSAWIRKGA